MKINVALVGDFNAEVIAHKAIPLSLEINGKDLGVEVGYKWIDSDALNFDELQNFDAIWCVSASPYINMQNVINAIEFSRIAKKPFLGTCGGYQHAVLEYAQNHLGHTKAGNAEIDPDCEMPLISSLVCKLVDKTDSIMLLKGSVVHGLYGMDKIEEDYHCSFGVNAEYLPIFEGSDLNFVGVDDLDDPRIFELNDHPFFVGTAFQPERSALKGNVHPIITQFLKVALLK